MDVAVLGGTGTVGREVVARLAERGHRPIVLSRRPTRDGGAEHRPVDLTTGVGVDAALAGVDVLVDVAQGGRDVLVDGLARALGAARAAGVGHVVSLSILGSDRVPLGYYAIKVAQEEGVRSGGVPWSIVRATQFHQLLDAAFAAATRRGVLPLVRVPLQPVDPREVAAVLADRAEAGPSEDVELFAGPQVERVDELARAWARARGVRRLPLRLPAAGKVLRAVRQGELTDEAAPHGTITFAGWLEETT